MAEILFKKNIETIVTENVMKVFREFKVRHYSGVIKKVNTESFVMPVEESSEKTSKWVQNMTFPDEYKELLFKECESVNITEPELKKLEQYQSCFDTNLDVIANNFDLLVNYQSNTGIEILKVEIDTSIPDDSAIDLSFVICVTMYVTYKKIE